MTGRIWPGADLPDVSVAPISEREKAVFGNSEAQRRGVRTRLVCPITKPRTRIAAPGPVAK